MKQFEQATSHASFQGHLSWGVGGIVFECEAPGSPGAESIEALLFVRSSWVPASLRPADGTGA